jgi:uncharacterized membrane protein
MISSNPFRSAVIRGLGVLAPPLLTVVIVVWVINTTRQYLLEPVNVGAREAIVWSIADIREDLPVTDREHHVALVNGTPFHQLGDGTFVPNAVWDLVRRNPGAEPVPQTGKSVYERYVELTYLRPYLAIPCFLAIFLLLVYMLGKFMAAGIGGYLGERMEYAIQRLPFVRSVYSAIKQVSNFFFSKKQVQFTRVVAVEYPRRGIWTVAFVVSEGLNDVHSAANEPVLGLFIPSSPMPMSGYAVTVLKREVIDLNITIDQAVQHLVSCGLVMPPAEIERIKTPEGERLEA